MGPATASAVLAACVPEKCCFFADEVAHAIPSLDKLKYTNSEYILLNTELTNCAARLNNEIGKGSEVSGKKLLWELMSCLHILKFYILSSYLHA